MILNYFKSAFQFLKRNPEIFFLDLLILMITLFFFGSFLLVGKLGKELIKKIEEKVDFSVYFKPEVTEEEVERIRDEVVKNFGAKAEIRSKEKALEEFKSRHQKDTMILKALEEVGNPFLTSLEIKINNPTGVDEIVNYFKQKENLVEKMDYFKRKPIIETIFSITKNLKKGALILIFVFLFTSFLAILVTLQISISHFKEEILIQKIVGATDLKISFPFIFEGFWIGFLSSLFSFLLIFLVTFFLSPFFKNIFPEIAPFEIFKANWFEILIFQILVGIGFGTISTIVATRKYLK